MKIASGRFKGQSLIVPKFGVRPTSDKVRQAVMNILHPRLSGARFLDLYCGTGAVGIEALSNGAGFACFVEHAGRVYTILKQNLETIVQDRSLYSTIRQNVLNLKEHFHPETFPKFDIIFADPFYRDADDHFEDLYHQAVEFLSPGGIFILEHGNKNSFSDYPLFQETKHYGDSVLSIFIKSPEGSAI